MQNHYHENISKALTFLENNLNESLDISQLAKISGFSPFHFHRIYKAAMDESPYDTILRMRLEKAVFCLKYHDAKTIANIGYDCGFNSPENFSRQFKKRFGCTPSKFRSDKHLQNSRIYQEDNPKDFYFYYKRNDQLEAKFKVVIEKIPTIPVARIKAIFGNDGSGLVEKYHVLMNWAKNNNIPYQGPLRRFGMSIDNPNVTPAGKYRYDFALKIDGKYDYKNGVEKSEIMSGPYATIHVKGKLEQIADAWDYLYKWWLPMSSYVPIHAPAIEEFIQGPEEIGWETFNIKCRIPITKVKNKS